MTTNQRTKTMTTFHPQQFDRGRCARQKADTSALQISVTNCINKLRAHVHEARKIACSNLQGAVQAYAVELEFYTIEALPLVRTRFLRLAGSSPAAARSPARQPRDKRAMSGKIAGKMSYGISAQLLGNGRTVATAMPPDGRRDNRRRAERCPTGNRQDNLQSTSGNNAGFPAVTFNP
jgi:hypothetical protein